MPSSLHEATDQYVTVCVCVCVCLYVWHGMIVTEYVIVWHGMIVTEYVIDQTGSET